MKDNTMNFKFCPFCGEQLQLKQKGHRKRMYCSRCKWTHYKNPTVGVAVIVLKDNELLLVKRNSSYKGMWCIPCGHVEYDEDVRVAATREFKEETGLFLPFILIFMTWKIRRWEYGLWEPLSVAS